MQIVIKLSDEIYKDIKEENGIYGINNGLNARITGKVVGAIQNGTPLPEYGNLKNELDLDLFAPNLGTEEYVRDLMAKHNIDYVNGDDEDKIKDFAMDLIKSCMNVIKAAPIILEVKNEG